MKTVEFKNRNHVEASELANFIGETVSIHGSIYKLRIMNGFAFVLLRTKSQVVQCIYSEEFSEFPLEMLTEEACVVATARVIAEERSRVGYELQLINVNVLSTPEEILPIVINQKKLNTSLENQLDFRPITLRNEKERAIFRIQSGICQAFREFLNGEDFTEIHSPKIVATGAEGGANIFKIPYFEKEAYLAQSPQFYKQMMVGVFERVYEIAPVFRAEKHDTSRHLNEYTSVDFEMGYIESFEDIMAMEMRMLQYTFSFLRENYEAEFTLLNVTIPEITEIPQIKFTEAKKWISEAFHREVTDVSDFEPEEERLLSELVKKETGSEFVFVTHYPSSKRPFYAMDDPSNPEETLSFDLLFRGLEITTGGQRIHNYREQIAKLEARGMTVELFESYLMMHKYGMPPHGGLGLGLERFTARLLNYDNVRNTTLFPRDINRLTP